jgi:ribosomal protein S12 methylthiotransferase accessory factor
MIGKMELDILVPPQFPEEYPAALIRAASLFEVKKHRATPPRFEARTVVRCNCQVRRCAPAPGSRR